MVFVKEYYNSIAGEAYQWLNLDIKNNPQWLFEVVGYTDGTILVKWTGLSTKEFKGYENN